jgi:hypothetical protein
MYDIFYISSGSIDADDWKQFRGRFPSAQKIENVKTFDDIKRKAFTKFFWIVWNDIVVSDDFLFDYRVTQWDEDYVHVWKNKDYYDGICLASKKHKITTKEFSHRFFINKKEIDIQASSPKPYDVLHYDTYNDYLKGVVGLSSMVWLIPSEAKVLSKFKFELYFSWHNAYDRNMNHVFLHTIGNDSIYNGIMLVPRDKLLTKREIDFRFPIEKKEYPIVASELIADYDIVFISYKEPTAEENWKNLKDKFPQAKRIHGVTGIHQAHIEAAKIASTPMFWVVDGDAIIEDTFNFDYSVSRHDRDVVHVWASKNPINGLVYGYGGIKLLPREMVLTMNTNTKDMTLGISHRFKSMSAVSNTTAFNTDPYNTWKSAFRECVKLASKVFDKDYDEKTDDRLATWCTEGKETPFGHYAIGGARAGKQYGNSNLGNDKALSKINDFEWLEEKFLQWQSNEQS